jgi:DNA-directed RNA polymerase subunit omega
VTIEDCIEHVENRFQLVHAAVRRTRQLMEGSNPLVPIKNRQTIVALREIAAGHVRVSSDTSKLDIPESPPLALDEEEALIDANIEEVSLEQMATKEQEEGPAGARNEPEADSDKAQANEDDAEQN